MYIYAFLKTPTSPLELPKTGIKGSLEIMSSQALSVLVEPDLQVENLPGSDEQLIQAIILHDQITCTVFQQTPLLPVRFGTCFHSASSLFEHLALHQQNYLHKLEQLQGKAEYCLQGVALEPTSKPLNQPHTESSSLQGRDYFLAKKQLHQRQLEYQEQQTQQWQQLVSLVNQTYPESRLADSQPNRERIYILISQANALKLQEQLKQWQRQYTYWQLTLGQPLPPYHFL